MGDYLLVGGIIITFFVVGVACLVWPRRMRWLTRGVLTSLLPEKTHVLMTRIIGVLILIFSVFLLRGLLRD